MICSIKLNVPLVCAPLARIQVGRDKNHRWAAGRVSVVAGFCAVIVGSPYGQPRQGELYWRNDNFTKFKFRQYGKCAWLGDIEWPVAPPRTKRRGSGSCARR